MPDQSGFTRRLSHLMKSFKLRVKANTTLFGLSEPPSDSGIVTLTVMVSLVVASLAPEAIMLTPATKACWAFSSTWSHQGLLHTHQCCSRDYGTQRRHITEGIRYSTIATRHHRINRGIQQYGGGILYSNDQRAGIEWAGNNFDVAEYTDGILEHTVPSDTQAIPL